MKATGEVEGRSQTYGSIAAVLHTPSPYVVNKSHGDPSMQVSLKPPTLKLPTPTPNWPLTICNTMRPLRKISIRDIKLPRQESYQIKKPSRRSREEPSEEPR